MDTDTTIDTGDAILHKPTGETWLVAYVRGDYLCCCGWPCSLALLTDCELTRKATAEERLDLLRSMAGRRDRSDPRSSYAMGFFDELATSTEGAGI